MTEVLKRDSSLVGKWVISVTSTTAAGDIAEAVGSTDAHIVWWCASEKNSDLSDSRVGRLMPLNVRFLRGTEFFDNVLLRYPVQLTEALRFSESFASNRIGATQVNVRRGIELIGSLIGLLALSPILLLVAMAVRLSSSGPVLYRQTRVGLNGRHFEILKFRSMPKDAEKNGPQWAAEGDGRVTPIGSFLRQTHLDELPQLLNILRGEMSFIGPRPERPEFERVLIEEIPGYALKHAVKPGVTGWAQVVHPYGASIADAQAKLELDLIYIANRSWRLDLLVLWRTVVVSILRQGSR